MNDLKALEKVGLTLPTPWYLVGALIFSIIGYAAYRYGKKSSAPACMWIGIVLMVFPYVVPETWMMYSVGALLCGGLYWSIKL